MTNQKSSFFENFFMENCLKIRTTYCASLTKRRKRLGNKVFGNKIQAKRIEYCFEFIATRRKGGGRCKISHSDKNLIPTGVLRRAGRKIFADVPKRRKRFYARVPVHDRGDRKAYFRIFRGESARRYKIKTHIRHFA